jgi:RNA polymerase sigma factor (TIGR02999 family)
VIDAPDAGAGSRIKCGMSLPPSEVTRLLKEWSEGDPSALDALVPLVLDDLRSLARKQFRWERADHTLQPTALINEVYMRLGGQRHVQWDGRGQFFAFAATLMRRILVDHAKAKRTVKRGLGMPALSLDEAIAVPGEDKVDISALDQALSRLARFDPRLSQLVELRFFVGLTNEEIADVLEISVSTVKREWQIAKTWLYNEMNRT